MTSLKFISLITIGSIFALSACATDESINRDVDLQLPPMSKVSEPSISEGLNKKQLTVTKLISVEGKLSTKSVTDGPWGGCTYVTEGWFAPASQWQNCRGSTGSQSFTKEGEIWPLQVGNEESYDIKGKNQEGTWDETRNCKVEAIVEVKVAAKKIPAYEVICRDPSQVRSWYISPELNRTVKYKQTHNAAGTVSDWITLLKE